MPLETATYISEFNTANPAHSDQLSAADSHMRLIKSVLQGSFPNVNAAVTATPAQLNDLTALTGLVASFIAPTTNPNWLRLNGGTFAYATHPALGAMLGYSSGTCTLPNMEDTGRFPRSVASGLAALTAQANITASHTHTASVSVSGSGVTGGESINHSHTFTGTTSGQSADHTHATYVNSAVGGGGLPAHQSPITGTTASTLGTSNDHTHTYSGTTSLENVNHTHTVTLTSTGALTTDATGGTETRPEAMAFIYYVHI